MTEARIYVNWKICWKRWLKVEDAATDEERAKMRAIQAVRSKRQVDLDEAYRLVNAVNGRELRRRFREDTGQNSQWLPDQRR